MTTATIPATIIEVPGHDLPTAGDLVHVDGTIYRIASISGQVRSSEYDGWLDVVDAELVETDAPQRGGRASCEASLIGALWYGDAGATAEAAGDSDELEAIWRAGPSRGTLVHRAVPRDDPTDDPTYYAVVRAYGCYGSGETVRPVSVHATESVAVGACRRAGVSEHRDGSVGYGHRVVAVGDLEPSWRGCELDRLETVWPQPRA